MKTNTYTITGEKAVARALDATVARSSDTVKAAVGAASGADVLGRLASMAMAHGEVWESIHDTVAALIERETALVAERDAFAKRLEEITAVRMGVGEGAGQLYVYGDYESIKAAQALVLRCESLAAEVKALRENLREVNGCTQPDCPHSGNYDYIARASAATEGTK